MPPTDQLSLAALLQGKPHAALAKETSGGIGRQAAEIFTQPLSLRPAVRHGLSLLLLLALVVWFWQPLAALYSLTQAQEHYSHIVLIPWISLYALYLSRNVMLGSGEWSPVIGLGMIGLGALGYWRADFAVMATDYLFSVTLSFVLSCWGIFSLCYGVRSAIRCSFALLFLLCMVPLPAGLLNILIVFLQRSSAEVTDVLFSLLGIPVFREGFVFSLSNLTIHVAEECSGIRSTLSLVITALVAGHFFLRSIWGKIGLMALVVPLAIIKNAFRIVGLSLLANYVDPSFITDSVLHRYGGIPLFLLSLVVLCSFVWVFRKIEKRHGCYPPDGFRAKV